MNKLIKLTAMTFIVLSLAGCGTVGSFATDSIASTTVSGPSKAATVKDAILLTRGAEEGLDLYVLSNPPNATLDQLKILVVALHGVLLKVEDAQKSGDDILVATTLATFNESLTAVRSYKALKGITQ